jgi:hypothetical protein
MYDMDESRLIWDGMFKEYGDIAILRMPGGSDRFCSTMQASFTPMERLGKVSNPADRKMLVSALDPNTGLPLDPEVDQKEMLVTLQLDDNGLPLLDSGGRPLEDERMRQVAPPDRVGPSRKELYWALTVRA